MKIAQIITRSDTLGGAHIHVRDLAASLQNEGHQVRVFVGQQGPFTVLLSEASVPFASLHFLQRVINPHRDLRAYFELKQALRDYAPDLVACHSSKAGWLGRLAALSLKIPVIFTAHGWSFTEGVSPGAAFIYRRVEQFAAPAANKIITVSKYDRQLAVDARICSPEKLQMVHNGIPDISKLYYSSPAQEPVRLIMVARFDRQKNHAELFHALADLQGLPWSLDLVGDGPLLEESQALANSLGLQERIRFLGLRTDVPELLSRAQIGVLITNWEGLPLAILEMMRAGMPVVASQVGGVAEIVNDGQTGFLIPRGDVSLLRTRLVELIRRPELRQELGRAGRRQFELSFSLSCMVDKTLAVYRDVLKLTS